MQRRPTQAGFTLVELVMVIVLVGIVAGILAPMIVQSVNAYRDSQSRSELVARGRLALERLARQVRQAAPNSLLVLNEAGGGEGIQFLTAREGGRYVDLHDDFGAASYPAAGRFKKNANLNQLYIVGTDYVRQGNDHFVLGNTSPAELIAGTTVVQLGADPANYDADGDGTADSQILTLNHSFPNDSPGKHFEICDFTHEVGLIGNAITWHRAAGITGYDNNGDWVAGDPVLVDGVSSVDFTYAAGTPESSGVLRIDLKLTDGAETIRLYHEVHVRNTP